MGKSVVGSIPVRKINNLRDLWTGSAEEFPDRPAFWTKPVKGQPYVPITYKQFGEDITFLGTALMHRGILKDKRVAILSETRYEWYVSYLAVLSGEAIIVPLDKELTLPELVNMLEQANVSCIIYSDKYADKAFEAASKLPSMTLLIRIDGVSDYNNATAAATSGDNKDKSEVDSLAIASFKELIDIGKALYAAGDHDLLTHSIDTNELRILLFTSGTTATAKAVMHSHGTITANLMQMNSFFLVVPEDVFLTILPLHHTYECTCGFLCPMHRGASIAMNEGLRYLTANLQESKATIICVVPLMLDVVHKKIWKEIDKDPKKHFIVSLMRKVSRALQGIGIDIRTKAFARIRQGFGPSLRMIVTGGAAVDSKVERCMNDFGYLILQGYGLTECSPLLAFNAPDKHKENTAGYPVPGVDIKIINPDEKGVGEICGRGPNIMLGYWNQSEETAAALEGGYFHTGDLGYVDRDGFVVICGRKKNVIVTKNGKNIYPEELEFLLGRSPMVAEVLITGELQADGDYDVVAEIFPNLEAVKEKTGGTAPDSAILNAIYAEIIKDVNKASAAYKAIRRFILRDTEFPKTTSLKIKRGKK